MIELATKTITAESRIAPHNADSDTMTTSFTKLAQYISPQKQQPWPHFRPRGYPTSPTRSSDPLLVRHPISTNESEGHPPRALCERVGASTTYFCLVIPTLERSTREESALADD